MRGKERLTSAKKASRSRISLVLYPEERWDGMKDFHCTYPETIHSQIFRPQTKPSWTPTSCSQKLTAGRQDKQACWALCRRLKKGWEALLRHGTGRLGLPTAFKTSWRFSERSVKTPFLEAWCYMWHTKSVLLNSFHSVFQALNPLWSHPAQLKLMDAAAFFPMLLPFLAFIHHQSSGTLIRRSCPKQFVSFTKAIQN